MKALTFDVRISACEPSLNYTIEPEDYFLLQFADLSSSFPTIVSGLLVNFLNFL